MSINRQSDCFRGSLIVLNFFFLFFARVILGTASLTTSIVLGTLGSFNARDDRIIAVNRYSDGGDDFALSKRTNWRSRHRGHLYLHAHHVEYITSAARAFSLR